MKHLKISTKLFVLVISMLLCMALVAASSLVFMHRINVSSKEAGANWTPCIVLAGEVNQMIAEYRMIELEYLLNHDKARGMQLMNQINQERRQISSSFIVFANEAVDAQDADLMKAVETLWGSYLEISEKMLGLCDRNEQQQALDLMRGDALERFGELVQASQQVVQYNDDGANAASRQGDAVFQISIRIILLIMLGSAVCAILLAVYIIRLIVKPLGDIGKAAAEIGKGNLNTEINIHTKDEIGQIAAAFTAMSHTLKTIIQDIRYMLGEMAQGNFNLKTTVEEQYIGEYLEILVAMRQINRTLSSTLAKIDAISNQVADGAEQVSNGAQALSQGATEQASAIEELSASIMEISNQVQQNADNAKMANGSAEVAGHELHSSTQQMGHMIAAMDEITGKSSEISKIIKVIEDIAFQTNILALNAAVEAARAGVAGKGFAVVADEVRNLASKSAEAAKSTTRLIGETLHAVKNGSAIADATAKSLEESAKATQKAVKLMDEITMASEQQSQSIYQVNLGVEQIASVVQTNSATAQQSAAASEELSGQAQVLQTLTGQFTLRADELSEDLTPDSTQEWMSSEDDAEETAEEAVLSEW